MAINKLTDIECRHATVPAGKKIVKLGDGGGLFLWLNQKGVKSWRMNYTNPNTGKQDTYVIGHYPSPITLQEAREARDRVKALVAAGFDPKEADREAKQERAYKASGADTVMQAFDEWMERQEWSPVTRQQIEQTIMRHVLSCKLPGRGQFGKLDITDVTVVDVLTMLRQIEAKGVLSVVKRCRQYTEAVFNQVSVRTRRKGLENPAANLANEVKAYRAGRGFKELPAAELGLFMRSLDQNATERGLHPLSISRARFYALTIPRPGNVADLEWSDIDWENARWVIPGEKMKGKRGGERDDHIVPLSRQALELLTWVREQRWSEQWVFPNADDMTRPGSRQCLARTFIRLDAECHAHGLRKTFSTVLNEHEFNTAHVEMQLDHKLKGVQGVYNKAQYLKQRAEMMQWWADFLDREAYGGEPDNVVELRREVA